MLVINTQDIFEISVFSLQLLVNICHWSEYGVKVKMIQATYSNELGTKLL